MDPVTITQTSVALIRLLAPFLKRGTTALADQALEALEGTEAGTALANAREAYDAVKAIFAPHSAGAEALQKVEQAPDDETAQQELRSQLEQTLQPNEALAQRMEELVKRLAPAQSNTHFVNNISGKVGKVTQIGTVNGNVSF